MDLRIYTPEGYRIKIPGGWKNSWATFLDEWGDHMRALAKDENWEAHVDQYVPVKLRRRERYGVHPLRDAAVPRVLPPAAEEL